ncbi:MAG: type II toxin-antitoxin system VapC family toxin [Acetobacteraceae bacterium]|nr:type II toxin-antitoxin system VapC family toxin [Acetobacteraceae bacterium]
MLVLLDTHLILWGAAEPHRLPAAARARIEDPATHLAFSVVAIWEVSIKLARRRPGFLFDPARLRTLLLANGYREIDITGAHALAVRDLPRVHGDPFDRILIAQARVEGATLLTVDAAMARYGAPVELVR